ncbi:MAG: two-component sensor histidine kinase [Lachnospiraceae bacterium]|nr:two-component sensor histidine kinase [Lachnospiraceae bacterium]
MVRMRSLRARIFLILILVGTLPNVLMETIIVKTYEIKAVEQRSATVQNQLKILANHLIANEFLASYNPNSPYKLKSHEIIEAELDMLANLYEGRVMIIGSNYKVLLDTYNISEGKTMISEEVVKCFRGENISNYDSEHGYIEMTRPIVNTTDDGDSTIQGVMLTSISDSTITATEKSLNRNAVAFEIITIVMVMVFSFVISGLLTRPFERITKAIGEVKAGYSNDPISVRSYSETVHISDAFNQLQSRMKTIDDSRKEFVSNVSHELKTPLTSMKVLADSLIAQPDAPAELYREFMEDIASEIDRENSIITDLLALTKMDMSNQELNITSVNIGDLAEIILKRLRPIARKKDVELTLEEAREIVADVDEVKMSLIMTNLVENAIKYNRDHGTVKVMLDSDIQFFTFSVVDSGIGIPQESIPFIYERFYRVDKSHSREIGGTGLGLAITRSAVLLHRGTITVTSEEGVGSTFTVKIPLSFIGS